jgi:uncharacterized membrane protein (DUF373 family)
MIRFIRQFEKWIVVSLMAMMVLVVFATTLELAWIIIKDILSPPIFLFSIHELMGIFGFFLLVLIGIELLQTIKAYLVENVVHVEIVLEVALIAIARKVIILDFDKYGGLTMLGTAALIIAVAAAYFVVMRKINPSPTSRNIVTGK